MVKTAICYFSGSGNSFDVTLELCKYIDVESIFYIPNFDMKKLDDYDEIIIVTPVYYFNIPKTVQDFIRNLKPELRYYVVINCGGIPGKAKSTVKKLFKVSKIKLACVETITMPSSYTVAFSQPKAMVERILKRSKKQIAAAAHRIVKNENKNINFKRVGKMKRYVAYSAFSKDLSANSSCTRCQKCIDICPTSNIRLYQGKIEFGDKCVSCMACYNRCEAIEYKGKKNKMYTNPNVDFNLMK